jgi:hypothetical protein
MELDRAGGPLKITDLSAHLKSEPTQDPTQKNILDVIHDEVIHKCS